MSSQGTRANMSEILRKRRPSKFEMEKALMAAKHPRESKFGECILNVNTKLDPVLDCKLKRLKSEMRRMNTQINQLQENFVRRSQVLNYEPMILVERPVSRERSSDSHSVDSEDSYVRREMNLYPNKSRLLSRSRIKSPELPPEELEKPSYMRQLKSRYAVRATLPRIDAFTLRVRRKKNVWEDNEEQTNKTVKFSSTVRPYTRLTEDEIDDLHHGWSNHKPRLVSEDGKSKSIVAVPKK